MGKIDYVATEETGETYCYTYDTNSTSWSPIISNKELVQSVITTGQKKIIKEQIKIWMDDHLKKTLHKEAGKLLKDIETLKKDKSRLGKSISSLKQELRNTKKEIRAEIKAMENMLEDYTNRILRYQNMDL